MSIVGWDKGSPQSKKQPLSPEIRDCWVDSFPESIFNGSTNKSIPPKERPGSQTGVSVAVQGC